MQNDEYTGAQREEEKEMNAADMLRQAAQEFIQVPAEPTEQEQKQPSAQAEQPEPSTEGTPQSEQKDQSMPWQEGYDAGDFLRTGAETVLAPPTGMIDFGVDLVNKIPGVEIPKLPEFNDRGLQALREMSGIIGPTILASRGIGKLGMAGHARTGAAALKGNKAAKALHALGEDKAFKYFAGTLGTGAAGGVLVDQISSQQGKDPNAQATLRQLLNTPKGERLFGIFPEEWATLDSDTPDMIRRKNMNEGLGMGIVSDLAIGTAKFLRLIMPGGELREGISYVPKDELAKDYDARVKAEAEQKVSDNVIEDTMAKGAQRRSDAMDEIGKINYAEQFDPEVTKPIKFFHDVFGWNEMGIRPVDSDMRDLMVQQYMIENNIGTSYGRIGSVWTDHSLKFATKGAEGAYTVLRGLAEQLKSSGKFDAGVGNQKITHKQLLESAENLANQLQGESFRTVQGVLESLKFTDQSGQRVLNDEGYQVVNRVIKKYMDDFLNMDLAKAQAYSDISISGQVSDLAEGARMVEDSAAIERAQEQILDRLEYLMIQKAQRSYVSGRGLAMLKTIRDNAKAKMRGVSVETIVADETKDAFDKILDETKGAIKSMRAVSKERPQWLGPLMLAFELTDGKVNSMAALNNWMKESSGTIGKAFIDRQPEIPSLVMQGVWANIYNSILSAIGTPIKAGLSNLVLLAERPIATAVGGISDVKTLRRGWYQYQALGETLSLGTQYMVQVFKRASKDPNKVDWLLKSDFQRRNQENIELYRAYADVAEQEGNLGPSIMLGHIETLNDLGNHPLLRFGMNAMSAFDGFTSSVIANVEARGRAWDVVTKNGAEPLDEVKLQEIRKKVYDEMWDENGVLTDEAVSYAAKEIAMNQDQPMVDSLGKMLQAYPFLKPFMMFPKTSINVMRFADTHSPVTIFARDYNDIALKKRSSFSKADFERILNDRGLLKRDGFDEQRFATLQAEIRGRKAIGSLAIMGTINLFLNGRIRGSGHFDKETNTLRREANYKPLTIQGLDGDWYSYENLGAITDVISLTADIMEQVHTLSPFDMQNNLARLGFIISAHFTNKSFMSGLEPLFDITSGNGSSINRWVSSFGSSAFPLSGMRNEMARLIHHDLRVLENDVFDQLANRNPIAKGTLPKQTSWITGETVGAPRNIWEQFWNTYFPWKSYGGQTELEKFLVDIEFDVRPSLRTDGKGVEYTNEERALLFDIMGEQKFFHNELKKIYRTNKDWLKSYKEAPTNRDHKQWRNLHNRINMALSRAIRAAEGSKDFIYRDDVRRKRGVNRQLQYENRRGNVERLIELKNK